MVARGFPAMRASLVERGLIDSAGHLTPAGNAHVDALLVKLRGTKPASDPSAPRVKWRTGRAI